MASVLSEYFRFFNEYSDKYGKNIAVLMQVGSFYEIYGIDNEVEKMGNAEELSRILNIVLTKRNKKVTTNNFNNPLMLGFPCLAVNKYVPLLIAENYTVIVVNQVKTPLSIKRVVVEIISPSINIDNNIHTANCSDNYLVLINIDKHRHVGMSAISVLTGNNIVHECYSDPNDSDKSLDETLGFLKQYRPKEVVLFGEKLHCLVSYLELDNTLCHFADAGGKKFSVEYQESVLGLVFDNNSMLSNIEYLGLERMPYALISYVLLIEFVYDHNPMLLKRMAYPDVFSAVNRLVLSTSTVDQLNVAGFSPFRTYHKGTSATKGTNNKHTLFNIINRCSTNAGKRLLMRRILSPVVNPEEIDKRYNQIDGFGLLFSNDVQGINRLLSKVIDIERLQRRMSIGVITPAELASLTVSYEIILDLDNVFKGKIRTFPETQCYFMDTVMQDSYRKALEDFVEMCRYAFDVDCMLTSETRFNSGVFDKLDRLKYSIQLEMDTITDFALGIGIDNPRIEYTHSMGHYISVTCSQAKVLKLSHRRGIVIKSNSSSYRVTSPKTEAASKNIISLSDMLKVYTQKFYKKTVECLLSYDCMFGSVVKFVSNIDIIKSNFITSTLYNYCRPTVIKEGASFVDAIDLRHPIIERIDDGNEYVPNNITIGKKQNGIILYSMNSCGKTSLLRALGLSVILAQAGCFVPATKFIFCPFKCIMTRILSRDNIMKGQSSFVAEMTELKAILMRAKDWSTLVLADEITHGTEHTSGSSIFVSSVETLAKRKANFLFTTHLHNVYPFVKDIPNVGVFHLSVVFEDKNIVFERKLKDGPGGSIYGLEVCEFLGMDTEFIARAFQIRNIVTPDKTDGTMKAKPRPSKYNSKKLVQLCEKCGYFPRLITDVPLDTHHIKHQRLADENSMINGIHKDALCNLKILCKQCHAKEHKK